MAQHKNQTLKDNFSYNQPYFNFNLLTFCDSWKNKNSSEWIYTKQDDKAMMK